MAVTVPVSWGELFDKMTILELKQERIEDGHKLANVARELEALRRVRDEHTLPGQQLAELVGELRGINGALWEIEDEIRACERDRDFSRRFVELARSVYKTNDRRAEVKRRINILLGSDLVEEKSYQAY